MLLVVDWSFALSSSTNEDNQEWLRVSCCQLNFNYMNIPSSFVFWSPVVNALQYSFFLGPDYCSVQDPCIYGHGDCRGRETCVPLDGSFGECRCDRFLGFAGSSCNIPSATTYIVLVMLTLVAISSLAAVVVCNIIVVNWLLLSRFDNSDETVHR